MVLFTFGKVETVIAIGLARMLKKLRISKETTEMSSDSHQLCPFSKWGHL